MSGFPAAWLRQREPYDHAARDESVVAQLSDALPDGAVTVLELACGTGSGLRFVAPRLDRPGRRQRWILVDHDPELLEAAPEALGAWARGLGWAVAERADVLALGPRIEVEFARVDLRAEADWPEADTVTTQALLDLVDEGFLAALDRRLGDRPLLAALSVDGRVHWHPSDPDDLAVQRAFRAHQRTDRGFGASPGVTAAPWLAGRLAARGMRVALAEADWRITADDPAMVREMVGGIAHAARELEDPRRVDAWVARRLAEPDLGLTVGHLDLLALPERR
jgi:SAM-dependent methyltransferase